MTVIKLLKDKLPSLSPVDIYNYYNENGCIITSMNKYLHIIVYNIMLISQMWPK